MTSPQEPIDAPAIARGIADLVTSAGSASVRYTADYAPDIDRVLLTVTVDGSDLRRTFALSVLEVTAVNRTASQQQPITALDAGEREPDPLPVTILRTLGTAPIGTVVEVTPNVLGICDAGTPGSSSYTLWWAHRPDHVRVDTSVSVVDSATSCTTHGPVDARTGSVPPDRVSRQRKSFHHAIAWAAAAIELEFGQGRDFPASTLNERRNPS